MLDEEIIKCEAKDKLVLEYTKLSLEFSNLNFSNLITASERQAEIKIRLNEIRGLLGMELI